MVDHFTSDRGFAVGLQPRWMLGITADLICHKSLKNNNFPPPPPQNSSLAPRTKLSTSQRQPTDRARPFGSAWVWPHGPKTLVRPNGLRLYAESLGSVRSTYRSRANSALPVPLFLTTRHPPACQGSRASCPRPRRDVHQPGSIENRTKGVRKGGVVYETLLLTSIQRSKKCRR